MNASQKILLIEDCPIIQGVVRATLTSKYALSTVGSVNAARAELQNSIPQLIILDIGLPDGDGLKLAAEIRQSPNLSRVPLIFLTGKSDPADKVLGFTVGADDYIVKPLEPMEFSARVDNQIRRVRALSQSEEGYDKGIFHISTSQQKIFIRTEQENRDLRLTTNEFKLLNHFIRHESHVLSRDHILNTVWGSETFVTDRTVDSHIYSIRKKLGDYAHCIQSIPRAGYRFSQDALNSKKTG